MDAFQPPYLGAAYYPELWSEDEVDADIAKMREVGINCMRVAEFGWGGMEPREGVFTFDRLKRTVDKLGAAGISVVMCTPSATPPKWLTDKYPETLRVYSGGAAAQFGGRCHVCKSSPVMREKNRIIVEKMCQAFQAHPAIVGWQIDNEIFPYDEGCFCSNCRKGFCDYLKKKYGTVEALNEKWGTARWSLEYRAFDDVLAPRGDTWNHPSLSVEWRLYQNELIYAYVAEQAECIKRYFTVPVGTDMMPRAELSYYKMLQFLDVAQLNHYDRAEELWRPGFWFDFLRPIKPDQPFWNTETQVLFNGSQAACSGYRPQGNVYVNTWMPFAHGGEMNLYWLWRVHPQGHELGHGAVLTSAGRFYPAQDEIRQASEEVHACYPLFSHTRLSAKVALHFSATAAVNLQYAPLVEGLDYTAWIQDCYYRPLRHYNVDVIDTPHTLNGYETVISPLLTTTDENDFSERILQWVQEGGTWIVGPMSDIMTDYAAKFTAAPFRFLEEAAGVYTKYQYPVAAGAFQASWTDGSPLRISRCFDGFEPRDAESLAQYTNEYLAGLSAITQKRVGRGKIILVGGVLSAPDLLRLIPSQANAEGSDNVRILSRTGDGGDYLICMELEHRTGQVTPNGVYRGVFDGKTYRGTVDIAPNAVLVLKKEK